MAAKKTYTKKEPTVRVPFVPSYPPSSEQEVIFGDMVNSGDNIHIEASPGSGKSTTLKWAMTKDKTPSKGSRAAFAAFSAAIVAEIEPGCASHVDVRTFHSFGYQALAKKFGRLFKSDGKVQKIFKDMYPSLDPDEMKGDARSKGYSFMFDFLKLVDMLRANLYDETSLDDVVSVCVNYGLEFDNLDTVMEILPPIFDKMIEKPSVWDFTDLMWMPIRLNLEIQKYPMVYVDERQDLNSLMIEYVLRMSQERIMLIASILKFYHSTRTLQGRLNIVAILIGICLMDL
jgi:hypothetical protein